MPSAAPGVAFSLVVPTYNRGHLIGRTLESLLAQEEPSREIIVIDDGSTDDTAAVLQKYVGPGLRYHRKENAERAAARNFGARMAQGEYVNFFDSDDLAYSYHLSEARQLIARRARPEVFHLRFDVRDGQGNLLREHPAQAERATGRVPVSTLMRGNALSCNGVFIRRDVALANPFDEERSLAGTEDWVLWLRLAARFPFWENEGRCTSSLVEHDARSVAAVMNLAKAEARERVVLDCLARDPGFMRMFGAAGLKSIRGVMQSFTALHAALGKGGLGPTLRHLVGAVRSSPRQLLERRTAAILKHLVRHQVAAGMEKLARRT